jgi:hypothetical protein
LEFAQDTSDGGKMVALKFFQDASQVMLLLLLPAAVPPSN